MVLEQQISMISETWVMTAKNFRFAITGINYILKHIEVENHFKFK